MPQTDIRHDGAPNERYGRQQGASAQFTGEIGAGRRKEDFGMWADMPPGLYDYEIRDIPHQLIPRHIPSGTMLVAPPFFRGEPEGPYILRGPDLAWTAELQIVRIPFLIRAEMFGLKHATLDDRYPFRSEHGDLSIVEEIRQTSGSGEIPWSRHLLEIVAVLYFIRRNVEQWALGKRPFPDHLRFDAKVLAPDLQIEIVNPYAGR